MFDIHQKVECDSDPDEVQDYIDGLMEEFSASPEAKPPLDDGAGLGWAPLLMEYGLNYIAVTPARMSLQDFDEVVFDLFPRKVSTEAESAAEIIEELKAFWQFIQRRYGLRNAGKILATLDAAAIVQLHRALANPANYGMAKSFVLAGIQAGYDMTSQAEVSEFMRVHNERLQAHHPPRGLPASVSAAEPPKPSARERAELRRAKRTEEKRKPRS